ncbi:MAG TPA: LuxR C-terminal-related transcriptional regulator [Candidatus Acidoferrales bacterium]|nr:LuxR C-terminal-related transcriptional regulator [Candidatus Acidoferrales bacterium]
MRRLRASFEEGVLVLRIPFHVEFNDASLVPPDKAKLTAKEMEVFNAMRKGATNKEIARLLNSEERVVKFHVSNVLQKLSCESRAEVVYKYGHWWGS